MMTRPRLLDLFYGAGGAAVGWMALPELSQAVPPAYTEHIGRQLAEAAPIWAEREREMRQCRQR